MSRPERPVLVAATAAAVTAGLLLGAPAASADCHSVAQADLQGGFSLICDGTGGGRPGKPSKPAKPKVATAKQLATLRFTPSTSAAARARTKMVKALATTGNADVDAQITDVVGSGQLSRQVRSEMTSNHLSTRDLGDYYTFAYIIGWQITHGNRKVSDATGTAVRKTLRNRLATNPATRRMTGAAKQEYAERLAGWISVLSGCWIDATHTGKAGLIEDAEDATWARLAEKDLLGAYVNAATFSARGVSGDYGPLVP